jgi:hypothetical protein
MSLAEVNESLKELKVKTEKDASVSTKKSKLWEHIKTLKH